MQTNSYTEQDILGNMGLVYKIARVMKSRHTNALIGFDDLVSEGTLGLIKALELFDPSRKAKFSTYAGHKIKYAMIEAHRQAYKQFRQSRRAGLPVPRHYPLDAISSLDGTPNHEHLPGAFLSEEETIDKIDATVVLKNAWERLSPKQRRIMRLMCGGMTQQDVAAATGVSPTAVCIQYRKALDKIRDYHSAYRRISDGCE